MRISRLTAAGMIAALSAAAHEPITTRLTWTQEISRIVYKRCASCHRNGGSAMGLATYEEARPWAKAIRDEVLARRMPPWGAVQGVGEFRDDPSLSQPEIDMIVNWVEGGAPEGDRVYLPPASAMWPAPARRHGDAATRRREMVVRGGDSVVLRRTDQFVAVRPEGLAEGGWMEIVAERPDGAVERLVWIRDFRRQWNRWYEFREPLPMPRGTRITVYGAQPGSAVIAVASPGQ